MVLALGGSIHGRIFDYDRVRNGLVVPVLDFAGYINEQLYPTESTTKIDRYELRLYIHGGKIAPVLIRNQDLPHIKDLLIDYALSTI